MHASRCLFALLLATGAALVPAACAPGTRPSGEVIEQARSAVADGEPERALTLLRARLRYAPRDVAATRELARLLLATGSEGEALGVLRALPGDVPRDTAYQQLLARALVAGGALARAAPVLVSLERRQSTEPDVVDDFLDQLAWCADAAGEMELPVAWRRELVRRLLARRHLVPALSVLRRLPARDPAHEELLDATLALALDSDQAEALHPFPRLLDEPETPHKLLARHRLHVAAGRAGEAAVLEDRFLALYPRHPARFRVVLAKARRLVASGRFHDGLRLAEEAVRLSPSSSGAQVQRALALDALGRREEARRALELALAAAPGDTVARDLLSRWEPGPAPPAAIRVTLDHQP